MEDKDTIDDLNSKLDKKYVDNFGRIFYFDIGVKDRNGETYDKFTGGKVKIYVEVPDDWDKKEVFVLSIKPDADENFETTQKLEVINGITYLSFETDHSDSYALFDPMKKEPPEFFSTGDNVYFRCMVWAAILIVSMVGFAVASRRSIAKRFGK